MANTIAMLILVGLASWVAVTLWLAIRLHQVTGKHQQARRYAAEMLARCQTVERELTEVRARFRHCEEDPDEECRLRW